jgi:ferredoxin
MKTIKVEHDRDNCIGCKSCCSIAPQNWVMFEGDGKARLLGSKRKGKFYVGEVFECDIEANKKAAKACPVNIIRVCE